MVDMSQRYDTVSSSFSSSRKTSWNELNFLFDDFLKKGDKVLDIGCGNGRSYEKIAPIADYIGIDNSKELIKIAKKSYSDGDFRVADALSPPFNNEEFDKIYSTALFHHIPSEELRMEFLREINRLLKPGGIMVLTVWDIWEKTARKKIVIKQSIKSLLGMSEIDVGDVLLQWQGFDDFYFHCFSIGGLVKRCKKSGFEVIHTGKLPSKGGTNIFIMAQKRA